MKKEPLSRRQFLKGAAAFTVCGAALGLLGPAAFAEEGAVGSEAPGVSEPPYVLSGDRSSVLPDKRLSSGYAMPVLGIGTHALRPDVAESSVYHALKCGYRLVDTARAYGNEDGAGRGIRRALEEGLITREALFVTATMSGGDSADVRGAVLGSLARLQLDYLDLALLHVPCGGDEAGYCQLEQLVKEGFIRSLGLLGVCRDSAAFARLYNAAEIKPALVGSEHSPFFRCDGFEALAAAGGVRIESRSPFGGRGFAQRYFRHPALMEIAQSYGRTVPQILLRWQLQKGLIAVPGSGNPDHIAENADIFGFALAQADMLAIDGLQTGRGSFNKRG